MRTLILVIGPESSGTTLIARICAKIVFGPDYDHFDSGYHVQKGDWCIIHKSLPEHLPPVFPDIDQIIFDHKRQGFSVKVILATRDINISEYSRIRKFLKPVNQVKSESARAKEIFHSIMKSGHDYFIWSYETFIFLGIPYLETLMTFLNVEVPIDLEFETIEDGNKKAINKREFNSPAPWVLKLKRRLRIYRSRLK